MNVIQLYNALLAALRPQNETERNVVDYLILNALQQAAGRACSFNFLHQSSFTPGADYFNSRYYKALERLEKKGYVILTLTPIGRRKRWTITRAGKMALTRINNKALEYYYKEAGQSLENI